MPLEADRELVRRLIAGSDEAWSEMVDQYRRFIFFIIMRDFRLSPDEADDVSQTVWWKLCANDYHALTLWEGTAPLMAYLRRVTINATLDYIRKQSRFDSEPLGYWQPPQPPDILSVEDQAMERQHRRLVRDGARTCLSARNARVFLLWLDGKTYREIAEEEQITTSHVGVIVNEAKPKVHNEVVSTLAGQ
ncbi:MAG TPA: hypothetical protein DIT46_08100 [Gemmatimonadetes bacterium]|nr:hypothetical protein [Gemmatimonadota bacterium]